MKKLLLSIVSLFAVLAASAGSFTVTFNNNTTADGDKDGYPISTLKNLFADASYFNVATGVEISKANLTNNYIRLGSIAEDGKLLLPLMTTPVDARVKVTSIVIAAMRYGDLPGQLAAGINGVAREAQAVKLDGEAAFENYTWTLDGTKAAENIVITTVKPVYLKSITVNFEGADLAAISSTKQVASIADFLDNPTNKAIASGKTGTELFEFTCPLTVVAQAKTYNATTGEVSGNGSELYVTDGSRYLVIYGSSTYNYTLGDVIPAGVQGYYKNSVSNPQLKVELATLLPGTPGTAPTPIEITPDDVTKQATATYVTLKGVDLTGVTADSKNFNIVGGGSTAAGYRLYTTPTADATNVTVEGVIYKNTSTKWQVRVTRVIDASGVDAIAADGENAPVEYFNLQGVRVENPSKGLYIRRQGAKVTKVIM